MAGFEAKLEASHTTLDEVERQLAKFEKLKMQVLEQGKVAQASLDLLLLDKAAILQQGQSQCGQCVPEQEYTNMLGLGEDQIKSNVM